MAIDPLKSTEAATHASIPAADPALRNVRLVLRYDGSAYHGWQHQPDRPTIQAVVEAAIEKATGEHSNVHASGRTDAGVHALAQVANFHTHTRVPTDHLTKAISVRLPRDVVVVEARDVPLAFHARFDAKRKTYIYQLRFNRVRDPLLARTTHTVWHIPDVLRMRAGAAALVGRHDFRSFTSESFRNIDTVRTLSALRVLRWRQGVRVIATANGFLMHMVRSLVGVLVKAGTGALTVDEIRTLLEAKDRTAAPGALPAHALFLWRVDY